MSISRCAAATNQKIDFFFSKVESTFFFFSLSFGDRRLTKFVQGTDSHFETRTISDESDSHISRSFHCTDE